VLLMREFSVCPSYKITMLGRPHHEARELVISFMISADLVTYYCTFVLSTCYASNGEQNATRAPNREFFFIFNSLQSIRFEFALRGLDPCIAKRAERVVTPESGNSGDWGRGAEFASWRERTAAKRVRAEMPAHFRITPDFSSCALVYVVPLGMSRGVLRLFVMARKMAVSLVRV
jgi:hypothetical protein